jgi:hypothetical protein
MVSFLKDDDAKNTRYLMRILKKKIILLLP